MVTGFGATVEGVVGGHVGRPVGAGHHHLDPTPVDGLAQHPGEAADAVARKDPDPVRHVEEKRTGDTLSTYASASSSGTTSAYFAWM